MRPGNLWRSFLPLVCAGLVLLPGGCGKTEPAATNTVATVAQNPAPPTPAEAKALIAASPEFSDYEFTNAALTLPLSGAMSTEQRANAKDLASAGWLRMARDGIELTSKAKSDRRWLSRPNATVDIVPLASKELVEVIAVQRGADGSPQVPFTWRWIPNEIGAALRSGMAHDRYAKSQRATATLLRDGASWTVLRIRNEQ